MNKKINEIITCCQECPYCVFVYDISGRACALPPYPDIGNMSTIPSLCPLPEERGQGVMTGVAVFIFNEKNEILVGHRIQDDLWGLPGGGMIAGETPKKTAQREVEEEAGIIIHPQTIYFVTFTNDNFLKTKNEHWITLYFICRKEVWKGEPEVKEPDKCHEWEWFDLDNLPENLFCDWGKFVPELKEIIKNG